MTALEQPLTELEKAEFSYACKKVLNPAGMLLLRRLLYQLDRARAAAIADAKAIVAKTSCQECKDWPQVAEECSGCFGTHRPAKGELLEALSALEKGRAP